MSSTLNKSQMLPDGWILCKSKSNPGRKYYFNKKTGKSSWTEPQAEMKHDPSKQKAKKEKNKLEKSKKEEQKKNLKRKSDSKEDTLFRKKQKQESVSPEKRKAHTSKAESPIKLKANTSEADSPIKFKAKKCSPVKTPVKNLANTRLSQLRTQLNNEIQLLKPDETENSPVKVNKHKLSPKTSQADTQKTPKFELKSPNLSESKCSTTQSPGSDSLQSIPSPSQFFAANKIISSMKAQLPEEYCSKAKPKDTFADIEKGICSQTAEYPFMKHPATPPQFSEASKLVSAIKSKLSYKVSTKETNIKTFTTAKDRMEALRNSLSDEVSSKDVVESNFLSRIELPNCTNEKMEVDETKATLPSFHCTKNNVDSKENIVLVVDTNIFIHELDIIKNVLNSHIKGYNEQPTLLVPWRVVNELDRLKDNNNGNGAICKRARAAMDYLYKSLPENNRIKGQSLRDANSHIYPCELPDDEILNCSLQQAERGKSVILLSNDKNLCNKAAMNGVRCIGLADLKPLLENKPQPTADPDLYASVKHYETTMYQLLANILENEMRAKYNNLWQHVLFKAPPWSLTDVLQCLLKHWIAVFNEVFPRIEHLITDLKNSLASIESKDPNSLSQSEVSSFKELCLDISKKCQIIPEYMELAKTTVERLLRKATSEGDKQQNGEMVVIEAFEGLWTVYSSFCAKLSSAMGVPHCVEDKIPGMEPLPELVSKCAIFADRIDKLTHAVNSVLGTSENVEDHLTRLEVAFKEGLELLSMDSSSITRENLRIFCTNCRNMLQEAYTKFHELTILLATCQDKIANN